MPCDDPFIEKLSRIHGLTEESCILLNRHLVNDLTDHFPHEGRNTILLLESPHNSEVRKGYPLAGSAGATVAGAFIGTMGDILHSRRFDDHVIRFSAFERMGVMNVSRLPLQKNAYCGLNDNQGNLHCLKNLFSHFSKIKKHFEQSNTNQLAPDIEKTICAIKNDLKRRIRRLECQYYWADICYVACGGVAQVFLEMVRQDRRDASVPHPGRSYLWFENEGLNNNVQNISNRFCPFDDDPSSSTSQP